MSSLVARSDFYRSVVCLVALAVSGLALPAVLWASTSADTWAADYERSKERRFTAEAIPVPADGLVLEHGSATWRLESGTLRLQEPAADGTVTGLVFEGRGRFVFEVADPVELAQLRRVAERPDLDGVDTAFTELVLRTTEPFLGEMFPPADNESYAAGEKLAEERHEHWLDRRRDDVDARVVCGLAMPGDAYLQAGIKTDDFDWLTYRYDALEPEEIVFVKYQPRNGFVEEWVRLDRAEDRRPDGRPSSESRRLIDVVDIDVNVDLTVAAKRLSPIRAGEIQPRLGAFEVGVRFVLAVDGPTALPLHLSPLAKVTSIKNEAREELPFLRYQRDKTVSVVDPELHDADLVVLLERPLVRGEERRLDFVYEQEVLNYLPGNSWYPGEADAFLDLHTATLEIKTRKRDDVRAMGELVEEREEDGHPVTTWRIDRPARVVTFSFAEKFFEQSIEVEGVPEVVAFANYGGGKAKKSRTTSPRTSRTASIISSRSSMLPCLSTSFTRRAFWVVTARASTVSSTSPRARFNSNRKDRRSFSVPTRWPINGGVIRWPGKAIATNG